MTGPQTAELVAETTKTRARGQRYRWLLPVITFCCGCLVGAGVTFKVLDDRTLGMMKRPGPNPDRIISELKSELSLTPEQAEQVTTIVREHDAKMQELHREMHPKFSANSRAFEEKIAAVLDDEQRKIWQARVERMRSMFPPPGGKGDGPKR